MTESSSDETASKHLETIGQQQEQQQQQQQQQPVVVEYPENRLAPFNPTSDEVQGNILRILNLQSCDVLFDLGCGDGRLLIRAAKTCPGLRCIGIEYDLKFVQRANETIINNTQRLDRSTADTTVATTSTTPINHSDVRQRIDIRHGDLLESLLPPKQQHDTFVSGEEGTTSCSTNTKKKKSVSDLTVLDDATCIYLYLLPEGIGKVKPILEEIIRIRKNRKQRQRLLNESASSQCDKKHNTNGGKEKEEQNDDNDNGDISVGLRIVTYIFSIRGWEPVAVDRSSKSNSPLYLYQF